MFAEITLIGSKGNRKVLEVISVTVAYCSTVIDPVSRCGPSVIPLPDKTEKKVFLLGWMFGQTSNTRVTASDVFRQFHIGRRFLTDYDF